MTKKGDLNPSRLSPSQGLVFLFSHQNRRGVALIAGSDEAFLQTGRSFFIRWPYFWEIWGRDEGITYLSFEKDLTRFLEEEGIVPQKITIKSALYEFPPKKAPESLKRLKFNSGQIKNLVVEIDFSDAKTQEKAFQAFRSLKEKQCKGQRTDVLSLPSCAETTFELSHGQNSLSIILPRQGYPLRILTPSFRTPLRTNIPERDFDLQNLFSAKGFYSDSDKDNILDKLETSLIVPQKSSILGTVPLASKLVLDSAGASFPIVSLDEEIETSKNLVAPILIGSNILTQELLRTGKLNIPPLQPGWGLAKIISKAFNKTNGLAFLAADEEGLEKTLSYFSQTFPYFDEYREGKAKLSDVSSDLEKFLKGEKGSAEAYFYRYLKKVVEEIKEKNLEYFKAEFCLPQKNQNFEETIKDYLQKSLQAGILEIKSLSFREGKKIFEKENEFPWEGDEALNLIREKVKALDSSKKPLKISLGLSESPQVREKLKKKIEILLKENNINNFEIDVLSAYKQGFFWLLEKVLPSLIGKNISRLTIRFAEEREDLSQLKRFYSEHVRWLQELYPGDEILSKELHLPLEKIEFEMRREKEPVYEILAYDESNSLFSKQAFSPRKKEISYLKILPEWGKVTLTTGWIKMERGSEVLLDMPLKCDLEKFWDYYQEEILSSVYSYIMKKTGNEPTFSKQPYFKRLLLEMWFSEPDYRLGLDEEIVSSLESLHDEVYFDTLDFLRGITEIELEESEMTEDTSRYSAPGNILPLIHPSSEGGKGKIKVTFEDFEASIPELRFQWKVKGQDEVNRKIIFPSLKAKSLRIPYFIYNGKEERIDNFLIELELEKEADYLTLLDIIDSCRQLLDKSSIQNTFAYPKLNSLILKIKYKELEKEERIPVFFNEVKEKIPSWPEPKEEIVSTDKILSPETCLDIAHRLSGYKNIQTYIAGLSYENRKIPVLEIFTPSEKYVSLARLITFKPTLYLSARQHANEVSSTNYVLKLAELLARDKSYEEYTKKINFVFQPLENPDGAALAYELQKLTPFHSLHAGRYSSLGMDIGTQVGASRPLLPEAAVRKNLYNRWLPDIYLNLHGYPSHEWVQQFSNYSPYLFRDYWIPRGWYAYYRALTLPLYERWKEAGEELQKFIISEMAAEERIKESNRKFYDRYFRWASRWQPHLDYLELYKGVNLYAKRRSSQESKLTSRSQMTFVEETPELMDETAHGAWLDFLSEQGISYLRAHLKYLALAKYEIVRIDEEIQDRIQIQFSRSRPGKIQKKRENQN